MTDEQSQAEHARIYGDTTRLLARFAAGLARGVSPLSPGDLGRIFLSIGAWLALPESSAAGVAALLRQLADALEHGDDIKPN